VTGGQLRYVDGSRSPSFYTASPAESDIETMTGDYGTFWTATLTCMYKVNK